MFCLALAAVASASPLWTTLRGEVVDASSGKPLACRLYIRNANGDYFLAVSAHAEGNAVPYDKKAGPGGRSVEKHTCLSPHAFQATVPVGEMTIEAERGKEYLPARRTLLLGPEGATVRIALRRFADLRKQGWYSGETHCHRPPEELSVLLPAEDLHVAFPLVQWVTEAFKPPARSGREFREIARPEPVVVEPDHVYWPLNTEYELFTVNGKFHQQGAFFAIGHREAFRLGVPPVGPVADEIHRQGGLVELDKHAWEWSMSLVPLMKPDLFELANNHCWRTEFGFPGWGVPAPDYMRIEKDAQGGFTEWGWTDYGFQNYYALLNCGYRIRPTGGTASGVHPVPLGFGRVYARIRGSFSYEKWLAALNAGRSFVTTGPLLLATVDGKDPGETLRADEAGKPTTIRGRILGPEPVGRIEVIVNGEIGRKLEPKNRKLPSGAYEAAFREEIPLETSGWLAVRCFSKREDQRVRFAHSAPWWVEVPERPLRPRREEVEFLAKRVRDELQRSRSLLPPEAVAEYERALWEFESKLAGAR